MSLRYTTPRSKQSRFRSSFMKECGQSYNSNSDFAFDSGQSTQQSSDQVGDISPFECSKPLTLHNRCSLEPDKENVKIYRKAVSLVTKEHDMSELMTLLNKVQISKTESKVENDQENEVEEESVKQVPLIPTINGKYPRKKHQTCRFIPLRNTEQILSKQEEYQICSSDQMKLITQQKKGTDYVDGSQLSIKDVYKMHVFGVDIDSDKKGENDTFITNNKLLKYKVPCDLNKGIDQNCLQESRRFTKNLNGMLQTYDDLVSYRTKVMAGDEWYSSTRKISKIPFKVLDAPSLQDDFYLNLIDWSSSNILAVALAQCVYLWSAHNNKVVKFCDFGNNDMVCSLIWSPDGSQLAIGTGQGEIHIFDSQKMKRVNLFEGHTARVGSLAWSNNSLCSGSKDKSIILHDLRTQKQISKLDGHRQEVCGLKWSPDEYQLASGGNDNKLFVWSLGSDRPLAKFSQHQAAVKALAWSPHRHGLLASGGGTADRTIRFFNTLTTQQLDWIDTGSQVCNLLFSKNINEIVSTHGYSMNQIVCWKYPSLEKVTTLTGHTSRVLFLAMSPDGETIVTGAGDETLRFWNVFPKKQEQESPYQSALVPNMSSLR